MITKIRNTLRQPGITLVVSLFFAATVSAQEDATAKVVIGPTNVPLSEGVDALRAGDAKKALGLLQEGLRRVTRDRDFVITLSNICAAYVLLEEYPAAISYCNRAIEMSPQFWRAMNNRALAYLGQGDFSAAAADIEQGLKIAPTASSLAKTRLRYQQIVDPLVPVIVIDDRRVEDVEVD